MKIIPMLEVHVSFRQAETEVNFFADAVREMNKMNMKTVTFYSGPLRPRVLRVQCTRRKMALLVGSEARFPVLESATTALQRIYRRHMHREQRARKKAKAAAAGAKTQPAQ